MNHRRIIPAGARIDRPGVNPTRVVPTSIDRLDWHPGRPTHKPNSVRPGSIEPDPVAVARFSTLHRAADPDGRPRFVRCAAPTLLPGYRAAHERLQNLPDDAGFDVPAVTRVSADQIWMTREDWADGGSPSEQAVDRYVGGVLQAALRHGTIIATGQPHLLPSGRIVCEDVVIAQQLEDDQLGLLAAVIAGLIRDRPTRVADAVRHLCHVTVPGVVDAAQRSCLSLRVCWSPAAFGLALYLIASSAVAAGPRSEPLVLLADEMLHRLDLAHEHHYQPQSIRSPECVESLLGRVRHLV
jgi:type IV secretory pathway TrbD component